MAKKKQEMELYFISEGAGIIEIWHKKRREVVKSWFYNHVKAGVEALVEAEAELARLNAEPRKGDREMTSEIKLKLLNEAQYLEQKLHSLWRAFYAARYDDAETCLFALKMTLTYSPEDDKRVLELIDEVRKEMEK